MENPSPPAEKFGKYEIIRKLSRSMTDVYLARDTWTNQKVVLKRIEQSRDEFTRLAIEAETRGAQIQKQLHQLDPRILAIYDTGTLNNFFFVVMEYCAGRNLAEVLQAEGRLEPRRAVRYAAEACSQLRTLHSFVTDYAGRRTAVIHGDIKPANVQISLKDDVRLLDFGISKNITATQNLTRHNMGSPSYCSPERLIKGQVDVHSDLWAVGVTLFEMVAGTPPYQAQDTRQLENIIQSKRPPRALPDDTPAPLKAIVLKALAGDLELRYHSAEEFEKDLRAFLAGQPVTAKLDHIGWDANATIDKSDTKVVEKPAPADSKTTRVDPAPTPWDTGSPKARSNPTRLSTSATVSPAPIAKPPTPRSGFMQPGTANLVIALLAGLLAGLIVFVPVVYYFRVYNEVAPLRAARDYAHDAPTQIDTDWELYQSLNTRTNFMGVLSPLSLATNHVRTNLVSAADTIIDGYRASAVTRPAEFDWVRARKCLRYAVQMDPNDGKLKGKLALTEGYVNLIQRPSKTKAIMESFRQAVSYLPQSPDPHLGLARVYVYNFHNIGEADAEFEQAEQRGFHLGRRELAQKADGYMYRSEYYLAHARRAAPKNKDEAEKWLQLASSDMETAQKLYEPLVGFSNVNANLEQLYQDRSEQIRLQQASLQAVNP